MKRAAWAFSISLILCLGALTYLFFTTDEVVDRVTRLERGPCQEDPKGVECQTILTNAARAFSHETACIIVRKAGYECLAGDDRPRGGDAASNPPSGGGLPGGKSPRQLLDEVKATIAEACAEVGAPCPQPPDVPIPIP